MRSPIDSENEGCPACTRRPISTIGALKSTNSQPLAAADEVVSDMNVTSYGTDVLSTGVNAVSNAAKSVFRKKNNQVVVTVKSNYKLYLK